MIEALIYIDIPYYWPLLKGLDPLDRPGRCKGGGGARLCEYLRSCYTVRWPAPWTLVFIPWVAGPGRRGGEGLGAERAMYLGCSCAEGFERNFSPSACCCCSFFLFCYRCALFCRFPAPHAAPPRSTSVRGVLLLICDVDTVHVDFVDADFADADCIDANLC